MAQKKPKIRERQIGKPKPEKKPLINPRYKSTFWTVVVISILTIFFIINNTRKEPESGPYPPYFDTSIISKVEASGSQNSNTVETIDSSIIQNH